MFLLCLYLQWHEKEMHVSEMMREWKERKKLKRYRAHVFPVSMSLFYACVLCVPSSTAWTGP